MAQDRPCYHFLPAANWMNDPNGLIDWHGTYHLFYQYNPHGPLHGTIHWGHATSTDLIRWTHLPIALAPRPGSPDAAGCWSGCAVDNDGVPTMMYTGIAREEPAARMREAQCLATSGDGLLTWTKHPANPVIPAPPPDLEVIGFRDPSVWREAEGWACIVGTGVAGRGGALLLYRSPDLVHWTYVGLLCTASSGALVGEATGDIWECPQFFPLGENHVLILSIWRDGKTTHTIYAVGTFDGDQFTPRTVRRLDLGSSLYAPQVFRDRHGRRLMLGWLREGRRKAAVLVAGWSGAQSLPRLLTLDDDDTLRMRPVPEMETLRGAHRRWEGLVVDDATSPFVLPAVRSDTLELRMEIDLGRTTAATVGLHVRRAPGGEEFTPIMFERGSGRLVVDRDPASLEPNSYRGVSGGTLSLGDTDTLALHILIDRSIVEVYANERACLTERTYPVRDDSLGLAIVAQGGSAYVRALDVWDLACAEEVRWDGGNH